MIDLPVCRHGRQELEQPTNSNAVGQTENLVALGGQ